MMGMSKQPAENLQKQDRTFEGTFARAAATVTATALGVILWMDAVC